MSVMLKTAAGLFAGVVAGGLGFLFWPHFEPDVVAARPAVEKPVFVIANAPAKPASPPVPAIAAPATQVLEKVGVEKLAAALKQDPKPAVESAVPVDIKPAAVAAASPSAAPKSAPPNEDAAKLFAQGLVSLAEGDIAAARLYLRRAGEAGEARAFIALGDSYDAASLARLGVVGAKGDAAKAHECYQKALAAGVNAAKDRIAALDAKPN